MGAIASSNCYSSCSSGCFGKCHLCLCHLFDDTDSLDRPCSAVVDAVAVVASLIHRVDRQPYCFECH